MNNNSLTLALVIPVYNEERYLKPCLDAIAAQSVKPDEVIVVDNNSTDKSAEIACGYDFVTLIREPRQHQVFAQAAGFNYAKSDILGRIDADSFLPADWVKNVKAAFSERPELTAVTGDADPYDVFFRKTALLIFHTYYSIADRLAGHKLLWGANFALKKAAWESVKEDVRMKGDIWEDYDLAFCLAKLGKDKIKFLDSIPIGVSFRAVHKDFFTQFRYHLRAPRTFFYRTNLLTTILFMTILTLGSIIIVYPITILDLIFSKLAVKGKQAV